MVIDLRPLNRYARDMSMSYETLKALRFLARPGDWAIAIDIADGFHCCAIAPEHRCYVTFRLNGQLLRHAVLPFGYSGSPAVFGRIMKVFTRLIRSPDVPASLDKAGPPRFPQSTPLDFFGKSSTLRQGLNSHTYKI